MANCVKQLRRLHKISSGDLLFEVCPRREQFDKAVPDDWWIFIALENVAGTELDSFICA